MVGGKIAALIDHVHIFRIMLAKVSFTDIPWIVFIDNN